MSDNRSDALMAFLLGAAVGAGVALMLAPASGEETRRKLGETAKKIGEGADEKFRGVKEEVKGRAGDVKTAIGAGRDAYARARTGEDPSSTI
jgi:gas vesicle protein